MFFFFIPVVAAVSWKKCNKSTHAIPSAGETAASVPTRALFFGMTGDDEFSSLVSSTLTGA